MIRRYFSKAFSNGGWSVSQEERGGEKPLDEILSSYFKTTRAFDTASENHTALLAWQKVIGENERNHTVGAFVGKAKFKQAPKLVIYVDSNALRIDLMAKRDVYVQRLATVGMEFSSIDFKLSKYKKKQIQQDSYIQKRQKKSYHVRSEESLTLKEKEQIASIVKTLPEALRETGYKAILASFLHKEDK